jgi:hypothetical protein
MNPNMLPGQINGPYGQQMMRNLQGMGQMGIGGAQADMQRQAAMNARKS